MRENDINRVRDQRTYPKLTDFDENNVSTDVDFPSVPYPDTLRDHSFSTETYQSVPDSTYSRSLYFSEHPIVQQDATYNSHLSQYPLNNNWSQQDHVNFAAVDYDGFFSSLDNCQGRFVKEQSSSNTYPEYDMATAFETPTTAAPIETGEKPGYLPELRCSFPECSQDRRFSSESGLRKHEAKHSKPYICQVLNCKYTRFGDKGSLDRHNREVHGSQTYYCPISSCNRHIRGFPRKYNLFEHQKRCHSSQFSNLTPPSVLKQGNYTSDSTEGQQVLSSEMTAGDGKGLRQRLENLYKTRAEIDVDIDAMKRCLNLPGEEFS